MKFRIPLIAITVIAVLFGVALTGLYSQEVSAFIDFEDGDSIPDYQFGMKLSKDGGKLFVAIMGSFYDPADYNHRLVEVDTATGSIVREGVTGNLPEEIEIRYDGGGEIEKIFVSNSGDGTVTVLNPDLTSSDVVDLTQVGGGMGYYPFGLVMGPQGRYLYVSTMNMGEIFRIDTEPGSSYLDIVDVYQLSATGNGRMAFYNGNLIVPGSDYFVDGAVLSVFDPDNPSQIDVVVLDNDLSGWPGANDVALVGGFAYVPVLDYNSNMLLYEVDLDSFPPAVSRTIDLSGQNASLWEHGIAASPDGNTLVVTCLDGPVKIAGRKAGRLLTEIDLASHGAGQCNEALFSKNGKRVCVTDQGMSSAYVLSGVPEHGLFVDGPETASVGDQVDFTLVGGEVGAPGLFLASFSRGPTVFPNVTIDLGQPFYVLAQGLFDTENQLPGLNWTIPNWSQGLVIYVQGLTRDHDGQIRPSNMGELEIF